MLGECIRYLRKQRGITQVKMAMDLGTSQSAITDWERDMVLPDAYMLGRIADYFGVTVDYLLGREGSKKSGQLLLTASELIELSSHLPPDKRQQWLDFGHFLLASKSSSASDAAAGSSSNDSKSAVHRSRSSSVKRS